MLSAPSAIAEFADDVAFVPTATPADDAPAPRATPKLAELRRAKDLSEKQQGTIRLTAAQDIAWALINSPAFLFNR